jgi:hypothetical protein
LFQNQNNDNKNIECIFGYGSAEQEYVALSRTQLLLMKQKGGVASKRL